MKGTTTVLFVDHNHALRKVLSEVLRNEGHIVLEASDLPEALVAVRDYSDPVDVLIADAPGGAKVAERLAGRYPRMRTIFVGHPAERMSVGRHFHSGELFLERPFDATALAGTVADAIRDVSLRAGQS